MVKRVRVSFYDLRNHLNELEELCDNERDILTIENIHYLLSHPHALEAYMNIVEKDDLYHEKR